tara:strand:+ start:3672 stop:4310 length:639 start_codon:yes stop_codon:yes gene_type:complete
MTDSIYDQLNAYGTVSKQRVVETFSGSVFDTNRWENGFGSNCTPTMGYNETEGVSFVTNGTSNAIYMAGFDNKRQYNPQGFRYISTCKKNNDDLGIRSGIGDTDSAAASGHLAMMSEGSFVSSRALTTNNGGSYVDTFATTGGGTVPLSQTEFMFDIVGTPSSITLTFDGALQITKTTALPTSKCQPLMYTQDRGTPAVKSWRTTYMECYNT